MKISPAKREALALLAELCEMSPDIRLGQLLAHLGFLGEDQTGRSLWDIDDDQFLDAVKQHQAELFQRSMGRSNSAPMGPQTGTPVSEPQPG